MTTTATHPAWVVLADTQRAKLLACSATERGSLHVEERDAIEHAWVGHEHNRPSPLRGKTDHWYAASHHEAEEDLQRFVRQTLDWLGKTIESRQIARLTVFAPPRLVGGLRKACPDRLAGVLDVQSADLMSLPSEALHTHPLLQRVVGLPTG
jgi:protein required for attachment to host cells